MDAPVQEAVVTILPKVIVTDLDRTLTGRDLALDDAALQAIERLRDHGIKVVLATGRRFEELVEMALVDRVDGIVAENGAIVAVPTEGVLETRDAGSQERARRALGDLEGVYRWGRVVGSAPREYAPLVRERLRAAGVPHAIEFNAEEHMLLPPRVSKASGAELCLHRLGLRARDAWAIGDGENDVSMLEWAHIGIAPGNAGPAAKAAADVQVAAEHGAAFVEVTAPLLARGVPQRGAG